MINNKLVEIAFDQALFALKQGKMIARNQKSWSGKYLQIFDEVGQDNKVVVCHTDGVIKNSYYISEDDILAEDWIVVSRTNSDTIENEKARPSQEEKIEDIGYVYKKENYPQPDKFYAKEVKTIDDKIKLLGVLSGLLKEIQSSVSLHPKISNTHDLVLEKIYTLLNEI